MRTLTTIFIYCSCIWTCQGFNCKFPNEGCHDNSECCSGKCIHAHPGTNPRCTKLSMHKPCLYTYQCEDRLKCGSSNKCCAKYWGVCTENRDCCDDLQLCLEVEGFYYKRCLYTNNLNSGHRNQFSILSLFFACVFLWS
ncbi:uncharacterized protein LOC129923198 [Biomphalaria glabrata]|uniref:Uncharacterized protein LOC129923198 n=1 Tax=Biomphalaria glabrata TaxID=6526 RepID=A0A9W2Z2J1_BIOGL|nr:uncharacterized protein LOC129923198 [Biomphalaria glabrata]XP_055869189.1 uncharacterized protein LOC129923198 [Biomphalaria glabrata]